jgi:membrane associated rhomboid family serine protease
MISAPVGFQCPGCVAEAQQRVPRTTTTMGGVVRAQPVRATQTLIGLNVAAYAATWITQDQLIRDFGMFGAAIAAGEWWRLLTAPFLHAGLWHLALNMFALWILGGLLEPLLGRWRFVTVYLVSALAGSVTSYAFSNPGIISVGASGAVFGLLGATLVALRKLNRDVSGVLVLLLINAVLGFVFPGIDWRAHLGGLVAGLVVTSAMVYAPRAWRTAAGWGSAALVLVVLAAMTAWRTDQLLAPFV